LCASLLGLTISVFSQCLELVGENALNAAQLQETVEMIKQLLIDYTERRIEHAGDYHCFGLFFTLC
jgi:hypothetical protein